MLPTTHYHGRLAPISQPALDAFVTARAIKTYGAWAGKRYCAKHGIAPNKSLVRLIQQLDAAQKAGF